ncbi:phosphoglycolate phosphatase [Oligella ureolytica]
MTKETQLPIDTVLFDLDGTLTDSMPELAYCSNQSVEEMGREPVPIETLSTFVGKGLERLIIRFLANDINATAAEPELLKKPRRYLVATIMLTMAFFSKLYLPSSRPWGS